MSALPGDEQRRTLVLSPDFKEVARARDFLRNVAEEAGLSADRTFDLSVAASEACANAIEHTGRSGEVRVETVLHKDRLEVHVYGAGDFRPPTPHPNRQHRGLGLPLMATLTDHLALYSRGEGGTLVSLTFFLKEAPPLAGEAPLPPALAELAGENALLSAVLSAAPVSIYTLNLDLQVAWVSRGGRELLRDMYRSADVVGLPLTEVVSPALEVAVLEGVRRVSRDGGQWERKELEIGLPGRAPTFWNLTALSLRETETPGPPHEVALVLVEVTEEVVARQTVEKAAAEKSRLLEELAERERLARALNELNAIMGSARQPEDILSQVVEAVPGILSVEAAGVSLRGAGEWELRYASGRAAHLAGRRFPDSEAPLSMLAVETGDTQVVQDVGSDPRTRPHDGPDPGAKSFIVSPLMAKGRAIGVLALSHFSRPVAFSAAQIDFTNQLAASLSQALDRARLAACAE